LVSPQSPVQQLGECFEKGTRIHTPADEGWIDVDRDARRDRERVRGVPGSVSVA